MAKRILVQHKDKEWVKGEIVDTVVVAHGSYTSVNFVISMPSGDFYYDIIQNFKRIKTLKEQKK